MNNPSNEELAVILRQAKTIAMVGASANPDKPSHGVMKRLQASGYKVIPVNPNESTVLGEKAYASLLDIPEQVDIVDVFRRAESTAEIADDAVKIGAKAFWLQLGIINEDAAARARAGGLQVIMDSCIAVVHSQLRIPPLR